MAALCCAGSKKPSRKGELKDLPSQRPDRERGLDGGTGGSPAVGGISRKAPGTVQRQANNQAAPAPGACWSLARECCGSKPNTRDHAWDCCEPPEAVQEEESACFEVHLERRSPEDELGITLDYITDGAMFQVMTVTPGLVEQYNMGAPLAEQLLPGCFILGVNSERTDVEAMWQEILSAGKLRFTCAPCEEFTVIMQKAKPWSVDLAFAPNSSYLVVKEVGDGPLKNYNNTVEDECKKVGLYDLIVEVNGVRGAAMEMAEVLRDSDDVTMTIARPRL